MQLLGLLSDAAADSVLLPDLQPSDTAPFAESFGTENDLDELLREVSARRMHLLLRMPVERAVRKPDEVRYWMNRGVSGFDLGTVSAADMDAVHALRASLDRLPGMRILMAHTPSSDASAVATGKRRVVQRDAITLHLVGPQDMAAGDALPHGALAAEVAMLPTQFPGAENAADQLPGAVPYLSSLLPLLVVGGVPVFESEFLHAEATRSSLQQVLSFRNSHAELRSGSVKKVAVDASSLTAWLLRGRNARVPLLAVANYGKETVTLHMTAALVALGVRANYLRPLLRSDGGMGAVNPEEGTLPANAALLAEVH